KQRSLIRRALRALAWFVLVLAILILARGYLAFRDRLAGYSLVLDRGEQPAKADPRPLRVGFARMKITPDLSDARHPVWLAGFSQHRVATGVHEDLWAIACVIDDGYSRLGIVGLDAIGFFQDDVVRVRRQLPLELKIDYAIICSTHNHSTPDLMGLWGPDFLHT